MVTCNDLINETEQHLMGGDRDELNRLTANLDNVTTSVTFDFDLIGIQPGAYLGVDLEMMYVWAVSAANATVQRAMLGTKAAAHTAGSVVYVNPKFSRAAIFDALNAELRDLSTPPGGLWQTKEFTLTTLPVQKTYPVPLANNDMIDVLELRWQPPGPDFRWSRIWRRDFQVVRDLDPADTQAGVGGMPSGIVIRIDPPLYPGRHLRVRYQAGFDDLVNLTDDVVLVTGIPASAVDIPPMGAAYRLMAAREAKRNLVEAQGDPRRSTEVPSGGATRAAQALLALRKDRLRSEYLQLQTIYPQLR